VVLRQSSGLWWLWSVGFVAKTYGVKAVEFFRLLSLNPPCQWPNNPTRITRKSILPAPMNNVDDINHLSAVTNR
jgi:hypothetical protein